MTRKQIHLITAGVVIMIIVITCVVTAILFPPAIPAIAAIGGATISYCIQRSLETLANHADERLSEQRSSPETLHETLHERTRTIHRHYSETGGDGHHIVDDTTEVIEDEPPDRPRKPGLSQ